MSELHFDITGNNENLLAKLQQTQNALRQTAQVAEQEGGGIEQMFDKMKKAAASAAAAFSAKELVQNIVQVRGEFQQLEVAFTTMLGSEQKANELMSQLVHTAATTPFDLQGVAQGAKQLLAYGVSADEVNDTLIRCGDVAAGLSIPLNDLVYLYGTTMTQGRMFTQDLRQFQGRGIPIAEELANVLGTTTDKVGDLVTAGKVTSEVFKQAFESMTGEGSKFGGLMDEQSKTITGQIANIEDAIDTMFNDIGQANEGLISGALEGVSFIVEHYKSIGTALMTIVTAYGAYKAALIITAAAQRANMVILRQSVVEKKLAAAAGITLSNAEAQAAAYTKILTLAQQALIKSFKALKVAMASNPIGLIAVALTTVIGAFMSFDSAMDEAMTDTERFGKATDKAVANAETMYGVLSVADKDSKTYNDTLKQLVETCDEYGVKLDKEGDLTSQVVDKKEELIAAIQREGEARRAAAEIASYEDVLNKESDNLKEKLKDAYGDVSYFLDSDDKYEDHANQISTIIGAMVESSVDKLKNLSGKELDAALENLANKARSKAREIAGSENFADIDIKSIAADYVTEYKRISDARDEATQRNVKNTTTDVEQFDLSKASLTDLLNMMNGVDNKEVKPSADWSALDEGKQKAFFINDYLEGLTNKTFRIPYTFDFVNSGNGKAVIAANTLQGKMQDWMKTRSSIDEGIKEVKDALSTAAIGSANEKTLMGLLKQLNDAKAKLPENAKSSTKTKSSGESAAERQARIKDAEERRDDTVAKNAQDLKRANEDRANEEQQAYIDTLEDGWAKEQAQRDLNHAKTIQQLEREKEDTVAKLKEAAEAEWDAEENVKKQRNKSYVKQSFDWDTNATEAQKNSVTSVESSYDTRIGLQKTANQQDDARALQETLKTYQGYYEQRKALEEKYAKDEKTLKDAGASQDSLNELNYQRTEALTTSTSNLQAVAKNFKHGLSRLLR